MSASETGRPSLSQINALAATVRAAIEKKNAALSTNRAALEGLRRDNAACQTSKANLQGGLNRVAERFGSGVRL